MNKGSLTEKLRGSHLAKIVILLIATMAIGGLAGCSSVSAQPGTTSTATPATNGGSSTGATPTPDPSTTETTPSQQPSQSTTDTSAIDSASTDAQIEAFIQAFKDAGFPDVQKHASDGVDANWGPGNSSGIGARTSGNNVWYLGGSGSDVGTGYKTAVIAVMSKHGVSENSALTIVGDQGVPASTILEIIHSLKYDADNYKVVYQAQ